ncbi:hypothetical protein FJY94_08405, partial [Candidatus Kaiserbacteria bacterium]|nr:hypothetical protein [Candidatus Kaiserbacteria bacterium]
SGNTSFSMAQGSSLGGTDTVNGGGGSDQLTFTELSGANIHFNITDAASGNFTATVKQGVTPGSGSVVGTITNTSVEQVYFQAAGSNLPEAMVLGQNGVGWVVVGTSGSGNTGNDVINLSSLNGHIGTMALGAGGNDAIIGSSIADRLFGGSGDDVIRAGEGQDFVAGGDGNDTFVIVGTTAAGQYGSGDIAAGLSDVLTLGTLNGRATSEAVAGETIDGGNGTDTLHIYGTVNMSGLNLVGIENIVIHSDVTFANGQLSGIQGLTSIAGDGGSAVRIASGGSDNLSGINLSNLGLFDVANGANVTLSQGNIGGMAAFANKGSVSGSNLSFAGKSVYGTGTVNNNSSGTWKTGGTDLAQALNAMQSFVGLPVTPFARAAGQLPGSASYPGPGYQNDANYSASLNYNLESLGIAPVNVSGLTESSLGLIVGNQTQAEVLTGGSNTDFILGGSQGDTVSTGEGVLNFVASRAGDDNVTGGGGADFISLGAGNDTVNAGSGQDFVTTSDMNFSNGTFSLLDNATAGDDTINLGDGNDFVHVGGNLQTTDRIDGGTGSDYLVIGDLGTVVFNATTVLNIENFIFESSVNARSLTLDAATIADGSSLTVIAGGSSGAITLNASAETNASIVIASAGSGADNFTGGGGNDTLWGGVGNDTLRGNGGQDTFKFWYGQYEGTDTIQDFNPTDDTLRFNVANYAPGNTPTGQIPSGWLHKANDVTDRSNVAGKVFLYDTDSGALYHDSDGGQTPGNLAQIATLTGNPNITEADFVLAST